jgi:Tol biopolymer transport system component
MSLERLTSSLADRYAVQRELGAGGMATVYLAHDLRHDRDVAIKVLHTDLGAALGGERFLSEIRTTARLQHPHILPLLDSGEADGLLYYVMPLVTGETLRSRLDREQQLPIDDAVRIAREVADALGYAHGLGVIHRDIKPENILLQGGHALVADFGIALAVQSASGARMTQTGLSLGTPQYMSPEQAMGERSIDARSDIYALGAVTYEMLVGEPPFTGPTVQAIVARLVTEEPRPLMVQRKAVPDQVEAAVLRALEKLPADRFGTATEFSAALHDVTLAGTRRLTAAQRAAVGRPAWHARVRDPVFLGVGILGLAGAAAATWAGVSRPPVNAPVVAFTVPISRIGGSVLGYSTVAISRDGQMLAYVGAAEGTRGQLSVRRIDEPTGRLIEGTDNAAQPTFSPDNRWLAFIRGNELFRVSLDGGRPESMGNSPGTFNGMSWSSNGNLVVSGNVGLYLYPDAGGAAREWTRSDIADGELYQDTPLVVDEAGVVVYASWRGAGPTSARMAIASLETGERTVLDVPGVTPVGVLDGTLIYITAGGALMGVPIDLAKRQVRGNPVQLMTEISSNTSTGIGRAALSRNGTLFFERGTQRSQVVLANGEGAPRVLLAEPRDYAFPRLSPDGSMLALTVGSGGRRDVWLYDMASGTPTRFTTEGTTNERPEWTPRGDRVLFRSDQSSRSAIWSRPTDQSGAATPLIGGERVDVFEAVVTPDGQHVVYQLDTLGADILARRLTGDTTSFAISSNPRAIETMARVSPDGKWVAFVTDEAGSDEVVVQAFPGPGGRTQISSGGGTQPVWSRDGRRVFYRTGRWLMAATVRDQPSFAVTARDSVFEDLYLLATNPHANYDVALNGTEFVMLKSVDDIQMVVVTGWTSVLRQLMAQGRTSAP